MPEGVAIDCTQLLRIQEAKKEPVGWEHDPEWPQGGGSRLSASYLRSLLSLRINGIL